MGMIQIQQLTTCLRNLKLFFFKNELFSSFDTICIYVAQKNTNRITYVKSYKFPQ